MFALYEAMIRQIRKEEVQRYNVRHRDYVTRRDHKENAGNGNGVGGEEGVRRRERMFGGNRRGKGEQGEREGGQFGGLKVSQYQAQSKHVEVAQIESKFAQPELKNDSLRNHNFVRQQLKEQIPESQSIVFPPPPPPPIEREIRPKAAQPELTEQPAEDEQRVECTEGCGRSFARRALQKHVRVCKKVFQQKRKEFEIKKDPQIEKAKQVAQTKQKHKPQAKKQEEGIPKWQKQSEIFRLNIKKGKGGLTPEQQKFLKQCEVDERKQCETCGKKFDDKAYDRHRVFCANQAKKTKR